MNRRDKVRQNKPTLLNWYKYVSLFKRALLSNGGFKFKLFKARFVNPLHFPLIKEFIFI